MKEKKVNRVLLYLLGFLCGHSAVVGMHPFMVPMLAAVYSIRQSTFGLFAAMLFGGAVMYGIGGWNAGSFFQMGPYVMGEQQLPVTYFLLKYSLILIGVLVGLNLTEGVRRNLSEHTDRSGKKTKRKGFLGIFGKKEGTKPTTTTTTLRSSNRNMVNEQKAQSRRLSEQADSLAARNAELNRQLQGLICQIEKKVQSDLQNRESEITAMRKKSFMQIGGLMGFVLLLLVISYIIIHRDAKNIKRYKRKTTDLIEQLEQSVQQNEVLITSRKKAVHTITHELRTPLTAITGYTELLRKECNSGNNGQYIRNILQSSDRMRDMLNTLLDFFRLDNGKDVANT